MKKIFSLIKSFINDFRARKGGYIFISDILIKINSLILSFLIVRIISSEEYGNISYARAVIFPLTAFIGLGANHALLRFGPIQKSKIIKWNIFRYSEKKGFIASLLLVLIVIISSSYLTKNLPGSKLFLLVLSFQLLFNHLNLTLKNLMRILKFNKLYGFSGIFQSIILLILSIGLAIFFKGNGYVVAISLTPLFTYLIYRRFFKKFPKSTIKINDYVDKNHFWRYGIYVGFGAIASQLLFQIGIIMGGNMISSSEDIAMYKVASLIPFNLLFIPTAILKADFIYLSENSLTKEVFKNYIKKYWSIFSLLSILIFIIFFINSELIIVSLFGNIYFEAHNILRVLIIGIIGAIMFRKLFGSILLAVGKASWNTLNSFFIITVNIILNYFLIDKFGIIGAAYSLTLSIWMGAFVSGFMLLFYISKFTK